MNSQTDILNLAFTVGIYVLNFSILRTLKDILEVLS